MADHGSQGTQGGGASGFLQNMANTLPPMMNVLRDIAGVELPGYFGKLAPDGKPADIEVQGSGVVAGDGVAAPAVTALTPRAGSSETRPDAVRK